MTEKQDMLLLLLLFGLHKGPIRGRTRFQKTICILKHKYDVPFSFKFKSYYYGPYSRELADATSLLQGTNLVIETFSPEVMRYNYEPTEKGKEISDAIISKVKNTETFVKLQRGLDEIRRFSTPELISLSKKLCSIE